MKKKFIFFILMILMTYALLEGFSAIGWRMLLKKLDHDIHQGIDRFQITERQETVLKKLVKGKSVYTTHDPDLGWAIKPNGWRYPLYQANKAGFRADREYTHAIPEGIFRITTFGDSFTHGDSVRNHETWQSQLETHDSTLEVLNFGVGGYGLDQAYLRYQKLGKKYKTHIVLIGFLTENIRRHVNVYRPFYFPESGVPLSKPRFTIKGDALTLLPNPLRSLDQYRQLLESPEALFPQLGKHDHYYQKALLEKPPETYSPLLKVAHHALVRWILGKEPFYEDERYNTDSEGYQLTEKIMDTFIETVLDDGALPIIVVFPQMKDIRYFRETGKRRYKPIVRHLIDKGYPYIDLIHAFDSLPDQAIAGHGHYNATLNKMVAGSLYHFLESVVNYHTVEDTIHPMNLDTMDPMILEWHAGTVGPFFE